MTLLQELAKYNRKAALIYQREIRLLIKRGKVRVLEVKIDSLKTLIDSFHWIATRQGGMFWAGVYNEESYPKCISRD